MMVAVAAVSLVHIPQGYLKVLQYDTPTMSQALGMTQVVYFTSEKEDKNRPAGNVLPDILVFREEAQHASWLLRRNSSVILNSSLYIFL